MELSVLLFLIADKTCNHSQVFNRFFVEDIIKEKVILKAIWSSIISFQL